MIKIRAETLFPVLFFCGFGKEKTESKGKVTVLNTKSLGQGHTYW